jgi:hypothetical protein
VIKCVLGDRLRRTERIKGAISGESSLEPLMSSCSFSGFRAKAVSSSPNLVRVVPEESDFE